jgi:phosphate butyryltransferase
MFTRLEDIVRTVLSSGPKLRVAVARSADAFVLQAALEAWDRGLAEPVLIGDMDKTDRVAGEMGEPPDRLNKLERLHVTDDARAVAEAVRMYREGRADLIMKGLVPTATLLKAVLDKQTGVPPKGILSLVSVFEVKDPDRIMLLTDAGVNIRPNLQRKADILSNALGVARALGCDRPRAAVLAATEKVNYPAMPATLDGDLLAKMGAEGAFGQADVAGPMALDIALSARAARTKGVDNPVAGQADILCVPDIESGNILYKALSTLMHAPMASVVVGSDVPVVVPSRGDSPTTKFYSLALAAYLSANADRRNA